MNLMTQGLIPLQLATYNVHYIIISNVEHVEQQHDPQRLQEAQIVIHHELGGQSTKAGQVGGEGYGPDTLQQQLPR